MVTAVGGVGPEEPTVGDKLLMTGASTPVPLKLTCCGLPAALSATLSAPFRAPVVVGVKVTWIAQFAPAANVLPQLFVCAKSPLAPMLLIVSGPVPVLLKVTVCAVLVLLTPTFPKFRLVGDRPTTGVRSE